MLEPLSSLSNVGWSLRVLVGTRPWSPQQEAIGALRARSPNYSGAADERLLWTELPEGFSASEGDSQLYLLDVTRPACTRPLPKACPGCRFDHGSRFFFRAGSDWDRSSDKATARPTCSARQRAPRSLSPNALIFFPGSVRWPR